MLIRVNRISHPVVTLGPGNRVVLWVQGCSRHCEGCASSDTWDPHAGYDIQVDELAAFLFETITKNSLDGLTITGGEPAEQTESLEQLITMLRALLKRNRYDSGFNILLFSGFPYEQLQRSAYGLLSKVDVAVCGPYDKSRPRAGRLVASDNQKLILNNRNLEEMFEKYSSSNVRALQLDTKDGGVYLIGIPDRNTLEALETALEERGVILGDVSWRN